VKNLFRNFYFLVFKGGGVVVKNIFAIIFFAAFIIFSTGCGNETATVENKVEEVKQDAALKVQDVANEVSQKAGEIANNGGNNSTFTQEISLGGISPGMTFEEVKNILGEPVSSHDHEEFNFANGVFIEMDDHKNVVKEIKSKVEGVAAIGDVAIGSAEQKLLDTFGTPTRTEFDDGATEYKYIGNGKKIVFKVFNGKISEIKCELDD